jgi:acylphosphatase
MKVIVNFYLLSDNQDGDYDDLTTGIKTENIMYLTLQSGDQVILPTGDSTQYTIDKIVKNLHSGEIDIYVSTTKEVNEIFQEIESFANNTLKTMFDSLKTNLSNIDTIEEEDEEDKKDVYLKNVKYIEVDKDKLN